MKASAWRATRRGFLSWDAWALLPGGGPWFWVTRCRTKRGARREARRFAQGTG